MYQRFSLTKREKADIMCKNNVVNLVNKQRERMVEGKMITVKTRDLTHRAKEVLDEASSGEVVIVSRPRNQTVVVLSFEKWDSLQKAAELGQPLLEKKQRKLVRQIELSVADA